MSDSIVRFASDLNQSKNLLFIKVSIELKTH